VAEVYRMRPVKALDSLADGGGIGIPGHPRVMPGDAGGRLDRAFGLGLYTHSHSNRSLVNEKRRRTTQASYHIAQGHCHESVGDPWMDCANGTH
jgi:hypothetical protein